jgi:hypothetical protein
MNLTFIVQRKDGAHYFLLIIATGSGKEFTAFRPAVGTRDFHIVGGLPCANFQAKSIVGNQHSRRQLHTGDRTTCPISIRQPLQNGLSLVVVSVFRHQGIGHYLKSQGAKE